MSETPESVRFEYIAQQLAAILEQTKKTNGRMDKAEDEIIRLQERTNPWTAGGATGGLALAIGALFEYLKHNNQ